MRRIVRLGANWVTAHLEEPRTGQSLPALDGVRAFACLSVMAYHINLISRNDLHLWTARWNPIVGAALLWGNAGVVLFFVLSGFLLFLPYARALLVEAPWPETRLFYLKRMLRIMPAYYLSLFLLVMFAAPQYLRPDHWGQLLLFGVLYNDSSAATFQKLNGPYWTLAIEWQFYLVLPWLMLGLRALVRRWTPVHRGRGIALGLAGIIAWGILSHAMGDYFMANPTLSLPLMPRPVLNVFLFFFYGQAGKDLEAFACGMLACLCFLALRETVQGRLWAARHLSLWLILGGCIIVALVALGAYKYDISPVSAIQQALLWIARVSVAADGFGFACIILGILWGSSIASRVAAWRPLGWMGSISYSVYIWHLPILLVFLREVTPSMHHLPGIAIYLVFWLWAIGAVIPVCVVMFLAVERPGMQLSARLRRILGQPRASAFPKERAARTSDHETPRV